MELTAVERKIATFLFTLGITLSSLAIILSLKLDFEPIYSFEKRELAHFIGFMGLNFIFIFYFSTSLSKTLLKSTFISHLPIVIMSIVFYTITKTEIFTISKQNLKYLQLIVLFSVFYILFTTITYTLNHHFKQNLFKNKKSLVLYSSLILVFVSLYWELIVQPFDNVYGSSARGYIQWEQIFVDLLGISLSSVIILIVNKKAPKYKVHVKE